MAIRPRISGGNGRASIGSRRRASSMRAICRIHSDGRSTLRWPDGIGATRLKRKALEARGRRQDQDLSAHRGLMLHALEIEQALSMKREDKRSLLERRQVLEHQHLQIASQQREVGIVIGLQVPELYKSGFVAPHDDRFGSESVKLAEGLDRLARTG